MGTQSVLKPPSVMVGGKPFCVRFSNGAFYLLSTWGIDVNQVSKTLNEYFESGRYTEAMTKLSAAGLGNFDNEGQWHSLGISPLELADRLIDGEEKPLSDAVWKTFAGKLGLVMNTETPPADQIESQIQSGSTSGPSEDPASV